MIRYLKINSIRNKIVQLTDICKTQSRLPDYHFPPFRRGPNSWGKNSFHSKWDTYEKFNCLWNSKYGKLRKESWEFWLPTDLPVKLLFKETTQPANQLLLKFQEDCNKFKQFAVFCHTFNVISVVSVKTSFQLAKSESSEAFRRSRYYHRDKWLP